MESNISYHTKIDEALELLRKLEVFNCDDLSCEDCPLNTNKNLNPPFPSGDCYPNQAREHAEWYRNRSPRQ